MPWVRGSGMSIAPPPPTAPIMAFMTDNEYTATIERRHFDEQALDLYWRFVAERQRVYARRLHGSPPPWTTDPIMQTEFITNMYRELDPGTQYVAESIIGEASYTNADRIFNVLMYRLMGSVPGTHEHIASTVADYNRTRFVARLREKVTNEDWKVFGDAYRVAGYDTEGGVDKIDNVSILFEKLAEQIPEIERRLAGCTDARAAFRVFKDIPGYGEFLAHQTTVDLMYRVGDAQVLPFDENQFAQAGPGARNGIWTLLLPGVKPRNLFLVMQWLADNQLAAFSSLAGEDDEHWTDIFPAVMDDDGEPVPLSLCNIQSTLCEWFKYYRIWRGELKAGARRYQGEPSVIEGPSVAVTQHTLEAIMSAESLTYAPTAEDLIAASEQMEGVTEEPQPVHSDLVIELAHTDTANGDSQPQGAVWSPPMTSSTIELPGVTIAITVNVYPR